MINTFKKNFEIEKEDLERKKIELDTYSNTL
jgi:hypothetical protein